MGINPFKPDALDTQAWYMFAIFVATIIACITQPMPIGAVSIIGFTLTVLVGVVDIKTAVQGFGNNSISMYALAPGKGIQAHREPGNVIHTYIALRQTEAELDQIDFNNSNVALKQLAHQFDQWHNDLLALITESEKVQFYVKYMPYL